MRRATSIVHIGNIPLGSDYPIRLQSMTNTNTLDIKTTVEQAIRIFNAGADYVRITTQGIKEARNLEKIKNELVKKRYDNPLIADVHFNPKVAEIAATIVEKVRINPGNYWDKKRNSSRVLNEEEYLQTIGKIKERFVPLLNICKKHSTAIRIGVNHGSLSERILNRYGDTPEGMCEAAMEFLRICKEEDFHQVVLSMKASNPKIMVYANRLLIQKMDGEDMHYPIHLGATEAGEGEDGRIKSAVGIGTLLAEGIGDTIRVSLTEDPEKEIPVANSIINSLPVEPAIRSAISNPQTSFQKRISYTISNIGGDNVPVVIADTKSLQQTTEQPDYIFASKEEERKQIPTGKQIIVPFSIWNKEPLTTQFTYPLISFEEYQKNGSPSPRLNFVILSKFQQLTSNIKNDKTAVAVVEVNNHEKVKDSISILSNSNLKTPVILKGKFTDSNVDHFIIKSASLLGMSFIDGIGDGLWIGSKAFNNSDIAYGILQGCGARISKNEYISCPTCGRTTYNITKTLKEIKAKTSHLKGLKIAVMGCIVNGPGEMADADYGFIGSGKGKVTLYKGKTAVKKNIDEKYALEELLKLIEN